MLAEIDSAGIAGWTTFGLAGLILAWLFFKHLPDKDRQIERLLTDKDKQIRELIVDKDRQVGDKDHQIERMLAVKNEQLALLVKNGTDQQKVMLETATTDRARMHEENQRQLNQIITHCKDEMTSMGIIMQKDVENLGEAIDELTKEIKELRTNTTAKWIRRAPANEKREE